MATSQVSDSVLPSSSSNGSGDTVIAQYLATKVAWWTTYPRILIFTASTLSTYNPETFQCTNQWEIADIEAVELSPTQNQFILRLEKSRFRSAKLKFACAARGHLLSLLARLRRQAQGKALLYRLVSTRRLHFRCIEQFANASHKLLYLQVTVSSVVFLDECGRQVQILPFLHLRMAAFSTEHGEGMVLSTAFHDRFFLCADRHECLNEIVAAASEVGVELFKKSTHITALQLRLHNMQVLDRPSVIRFDVKKALSTEGNGEIAPGTDGGDNIKKAYKKIQLILQGDAIVEMHRSMRTVIARPYSALLAIVRPDWDPRTLVLEFKQEDTLVLDVDGRDQLVTLLLLVCREAGQHNIVLLSSGLNYCRFYHPHAADRAERDDSIAGPSMGTFLLKRITQISIRPEDSTGKSRGSSVWSPRKRRNGDASTPRASQGNNDTPRSAASASSGRNGWFQRRINKDKRTTEPQYETRNSIDSGMSMNESVSITIAMEEFNGNLPLDELATSGPEQIEEVNKAMELVFEYLVTLVDALRRYGDTTSSELITTLQALVRLYHHPDAFFTNEMIPRVSDAVHELILQQDVLICYWCLRLLQCFLGVRTPNTAPDANASGDQRAKLIQHLVHHGTLQHAIVDLIPASFAASNASSLMAASSVIGTAFWTIDPEAVHSPPPSLSSTQSSFLCTKEARVQNEINVVFYETLLTLHHLLVYLRTFAKMQRAARDRENYIAANNQQTHRMHEFGDVPAEKQTDALADKLLEKHRFLMDSIVDVRLVRMAETSVEIVKFVLGHFATKTTASQLQLVAPEDNQLSHLSENFCESRKKRLGALGSFLDDYHAVTESRAETRSLLFGTERTIEMPVHALSYGTSESTNAAMERLLNPGTTNRLGTAMSNGSMRLEYLDPSEPPSSIRGNDIFTDPSKPESSVKSCGEHIGTKSWKVPSDQPTNYDAYGSLNPGNNNQAYQLSLPSSLRRLIGQTSPVRSIQSDVGTNLFKSDDENDTVAPLLHSDHVSTATTSPRAVRKAFQASDGARRTANECDACIGCNDVCTNERCFFCAEKEYQLKAMFAGSSVATGPTARQTAWQHRAPSSVDSSFNVEREYSSCEMKRHQSQHSCWIRVDDSVLDVTDLLGVHPGGAQVLLEAAQHGGDCGPILKTHPPEARAMLMQYHLGRYYECDKS